MENKKKIMNRYKSLDMIIIRKIRFQINYNNNLTLRMNLILMILSNKVKMNKNNSNVCQNNKH